MMVLGKFLEKGCLSSVPYGMQKKQHDGLPKGIFMGSAAYLGILDRDYLVVYLGFIAVVAVVAESLEFDVGLSTLPTLSVAFQILGLSFLNLKIQKSKSVAGISRKALTMQLLVHVLRLMSTTWLRGYIPSDATGDFLYQVLDVVVVMFYFVLLLQVLKTFRDSYQEEHDNFDIRPLVLFCWILAILIHPDLNDRALFDTIWAASTYIDVFALLPQLWMMSKIGGRVEALTGHYMASIATSRLATFVFWLYGHVELAPMMEEGQEGPAPINLPGFLVLGAHAVSLLLMVDFMFFYAKACTYGRSSGILRGPIDIGVMQI